MPITPTPIHAFFDFDDTLAAGDSILYWMRFYYARRPKRRVFMIANWFGILLFLFRLLDSHALKRLFLWPIAFEKAEELDKLAQAFVFEDLAHRFHRPILERLWSHHLLGHRVVVISASATFYLQHLKCLLPPVDLLGTALTLPTTGLRIPRYRDGNLRGARKIDRLRIFGYGDAGPLGFAYSDHHHDMPLLSFVEFPTCVFPTPRLKRRAQSLAWPIWEWQGRPPRWKRRLHKLGLLLFGLEFFSESTVGMQVPPLPGQPSNSGEALFLKDHAIALRDRVLTRHPGDEGALLCSRVLGPTGRTLNL